MESGTLKLRGSSSHFHYTHQESTPEHPPQTPSLCGSSDAKAPSFFPPWEHVGQALWHPLKLGSVPTDPRHEPERKCLRAETRPGPHAWWPRTENKASLSFHPPLRVRDVPGVGGLHSSRSLRQTPTFIVRGRVVAPAPGCRSASPPAVARRHVAGAQGRGARKMESWARSAADCISDWPCRQRQPGWRTGDEHVFV